MRAQPYPVAKLTGGMDVSLDAFFLTDVKSPNLDFVRFHKGLVKKDYGLASFDGVSERCMFIDNYYQLDGDEYLILLTVDHAYRYDTSSEVWVLISADPGPSFTGTADNMFSSTTINDLFVVTNGFDAIQKWNGTTWASLGGWSAASYKAKFIHPFYNRLLAGYTIESGVACPHRVRWTVLGDPEDVTGTGSGFVDLSDTVDFITGFCLFADRLFVFKERSIWELIYVGGSQVFRPRMVIDGVGTYCGQSIISLGDRIIFYGSDGIYTFDGIRLQSVGESMFQLLYETGEKLIDGTKLHRSPSVYMEETGDYLITLPTNTSLGEPELLLKYNLLDESWCKKTYKMTCFGLNSAVPQLTWAACTSAWNSGNWERPWKLLQLPAGAPTTLYGHSDGTVKEDNRTTKDSVNLMVWESKDFIYGRSSRITQVRFLVKGDPFDVGYSTDQGRSWTQDVELTPDSDDFKELIHYVNFTTQSLRIRVRTRNDDFELKWLEPWAVDRVRSINTL